MYNWSHIDEEAMKRENPEKYRLWRLTQMINYDLQGEKLDRNEVMDLWSEIKGKIDPYRRRSMEFLLWGKRYSLPTNLTLWNKRPTSRP
ncbi:hypothetical protein HY339_00695 [Candidatus Gottesmanbacteria bacterium]|nr:hypothetical protein [Candidatus Gottesmanbacteria bacterium]